MRYWRIAGFTTSDVPSVTSNKYRMITIPWIQERMKRKERKANISIIFHGRWKFVSFSAGRSWKPLHWRAQIRWTNKVTVMIPLPIQSYPFSFLQPWVMLMLQYFGFLQRNAGKVEGSEWKWEQSEVKFSCLHLYWIQLLSCIY